MRKSILGFYALFLIAALSVPPALAGEPGPWIGPNVQALAERQEAPRKGFWAKARRISEAVLIGGHVADMHSSLTAPQGLYEANGLLRSPDGRFGRRGLAIKSGVVAGMILVQRLANRSGKHDRLVSIANFAQGGAAFGIAARNYRMEPVYVTAGVPLVGQPR